MIDGAYWLRKPGPNADIVIAYQGCVAPEAIEAAGRIGEDRRDIGVLAVTSADRLNAGWTGRPARPQARHGARRAAMSSGCSPACRAHCTADHRDRRPPGDAGLARRSVHGHRTVALGVEHFGQTGTIADLYRHYGIDADSIVAAAHGLAPGRPLRNLGVVA